MIEIFGRLVREILITKNARPNRYGVFFDFLGVMGYDRRKAREAEGVR
jgi:hypothetical protein